MHLYMLSIMTSQGWLLYTYSIQISVMLQFPSPLCVNFSVSISHVGAMGMEDMSKGWIL